MKILFFILTLFIVFSTFSSFSQNLSSLYDLVENKSNDIDKALEYIADAGKLAQEANNYYNEVSQLQSNYDQDEKTLQKQLSKIEEKALAIQIKADKLYSEAYKSLNKICLDELNSSDLSHGESEPYIKSANDLMNQATEKRKSASDSKNAPEKATLLNDAAGFEGAAIEYLLSALQVQKGLTPANSQEDEMEEDAAIYKISENREQESSQQIYNETAVNTFALMEFSENLAVDKTIVQKYQDYLFDSSIPEPITINRSGVTGVTNLSVENAKDIFFAMQFGNAPLVKLTDTTAINYQQEAVADTMTNLAQSERNSQSIRQFNKASDQQSVLEEYRKKREMLDLDYSQQSSGVRFIVQIAASRAPLTRAQLWAIYPGNQNVDVIHEEGWYKYRIGNFRTFTDANRVAFESGLKNVWVLATYENNRISMAEAREMTRVLESDVKRYGDKAAAGGTDLYIQVAASLIRFSDSQRESVCGNSENCREIIEEGWFKYQIYAGNDYQEAVRLKQQITRKSFIVAYEKGTKIKINHAINK